MMKQDFQLLGRWLYEFISRGYQNDGSKTKSMQATMFMLDSTGVWNSKYKNSYADYAIGGPTSELLECSNGAIKYRKNKWTLPVYNYHGYFVHSLSGGSVPDDQTYRGSIYWTATPYGNAYKGETDSLYTFKGWNFSSERINKEFGFRPVVRINSKYKLITSDGGNTYKLSN